MNELKNMIFKNALLVAFLMTIYTNSHAEISEIAMPSSTDLEDNPYTLSSVNQLKSLKELNNKNTVQNYQAPFVHELPNSMQVRTLFVESNALPMVDIQITFNAGSARDEVIAPGMYGMSNMAAKLMIEGTEQLTAQQISSTFEGLGAKYSINAYRDMFTVRLRVLNDPNKLTPALNLLLDLIKNATFKQSGINLMLTNTQVGQKQIQENPSRLMSIQFYRSIYERHPYAQPITGTNGSIRKITPELLKQFRDKLLVAQNSNIAITGQLNTDQAQQIAEVISTNLPQGEKQLPLESPLEKLGIDLKLIKNQSNQAHVMMGHLSVDRNHPDRIALEVANRIFGGGSFNSLLSKELRVKRGLTYSASSNITSPQVAGIFSMSYATKQNQLLESLAIAHQTLIDFSQQPVSANLLKETKDNILRSFPMSLTSNSNINAQIASIGFYGLNANYLNEYQQQVKKLTINDLQRVIKQHFKPENLTVVVVTSENSIESIQDVFDQNLLNDKKVK